MRQAEPLDEPVDPVVEAHVRASEQPPSDRTDVLLSGGPEIVADRHRLEHLQELKRAGQARLGPAVRPPAADVAVVEFDASLVRSVLTQDAIEQRRLSASVRTDDSEDLTLPEIERHIVDRLDAAERLGDVANPHDHVGFVVGGEVRAVVDHGHDEFLVALSRRRFCSVARSWLNDPAIPLGAISIMTTTKMPNHTR